MNEENLPTKLYYFGKAPTHVTQNEVVEYFAYALELSWAKVMFEGKKDKILEFLQEEMVKQGYDLNALSVPKIWWLLVLISMQHMFKYYEAEFAVQTVGYLLRRLPELSEELLESRANSLHMLMKNELEDGLIIRPLELKVLDSMSYYADLSIQFFVERKDRIIRILKKHLIQKDLKEKYLDIFMMKDRKILKKFSDVWHGYFEIFMHYFVMIYDFNLDLANMSEEEVEKTISQLVLTFLVASIETKPKIEALHEELTSCVAGIHTYTHEM